MSDNLTQATILVADDDRITRELLSGLLRGHGFKVEQASDGQELIDRVGRGGLDLVLTDIIMPRLSGLEACRIIKSMSPDTFLPVLLVTVKSDIDSKVAGLKLGADDYVTKPFDEKELIARVHAMLRIKRMHDTVQSTKKELEDLAVHDELTGLYNYRYLQTRLTEEFKRAERYHDPLSCTMIDIDHFKEVNDTHGHPFGDAVLEQLAEILRSEVREVDVVARYGGEEFLLILPSTHFNGSLTVADRIWRSVSGREFTSGSRSARITVSMGISFYPSRDVKTRDELLKFADQALYQAKREGRNRICLYQHHGYVYDPGVESPPSIAPAGSARDQAGESRGDRGSKR
ncbi:MAG: diguanylate cyclase [Deltaproteobacteria bacterium]|nr:diguanylate cyclase [Deltaproteobacteria bacterium]